jgi:hypothetical protein
LRSKCCAPAGRLLSLYASKSRSRLSDVAYDKRTKQ